MAVVWLSRPTRLLSLPHSFFECTLHKLTPRADIARSARLISILPQLRAKRHNNGRPFPQSTRHGIPSRISHAPLLIAPFLCVRRFPALSQPDFPRLPPQRAAVRLRYLAVALPPNCHPGEGATRRAFLLAGPSFIQVGQQRAARRGHSVVIPAEIPFQWAGRSVSRWACLCPR